MKIILLLSLLAIAFSYNCIREPKNYPCPKNAFCTNSGICQCNQFYYGDNCEKVLQNSNSLNQVSIGFSQSGYLGLIFGLSFSYPFFLIIGLLIIYYAMKDRDL